MQSRSNKIFLPTHEDHHPTRSIHLGKHNGQVIIGMAKKMDKIFDYVMSNGLNKEQAQTELNNIILEEMQKLRKGERALNKNKRPWSDNSDLDDFITKTHGDKNG